MRILTVEDDEFVTRVIDKTCQDEGFICQASPNGTDGLEMIKYYDFDVIILDLMLPDIDGFEIIERTRAIKNSTPIIILSGLSNPDDKVKGFSLGADDYLTKPFSKVELVARILAIVRRSNGLSSSEINVGPMTIDIKQRSVAIFGKEVFLTKKEYAILELLALKKGCILSKESFLNHIYGGMDEPEIKIVDVFVCKLRRKLAEYSGGMNFIDTVWGRGYILRDLSATEEYNQAEDIKQVV
jgi:two-component system cell cycle response regulator CtrA